MRRVWGLAGVALVALSACAPSVPDSGAGVGFGDYEVYREQQRLRDEALQGRQTIPGPAAVQQSPLDSEGQAAAQARALNSGVDPVSARPGNPAPAIVTTPGGISRENDFDAVSGRRTIQDDANLIAQNRSQYTVVQPTALPTRDGGERPNIVAFALGTTHPVGTKLYRRSSLGNAEARMQRACFAFASPDLAQEEFLAKGGPERDRLGVDPDGDGYACSWNPAPFRLAGAGQSGGA